MIAALSIAQQYNQNCWTAVGFIDIIPPAMKSVALLFLLCLPSLGFSQQPARPKWEWKQVGSTTREFNALDGQAYGLPKAKAVKVAVDADSAVFFGILPKQKVAAYVQAKRPLRKTDFQGMPCAQVNVVKGAAACRIDALPFEGVLYVRDKRAEGTEALGVLGGMHMNSQLADRATKPNRVTVTLFVPVCVENCPVEQTGR